MPAYQSKHEIESIVAQQVEEWALKFKNHYDGKLQNVQKEQKETLAIVNRLGKYVNNLELKVKAITTSVKKLQDENGEIEFPSDMNNYHSSGKSGNGTADLASRLDMLETFCGYEPEREAYAALGMGTGDLLLPEHKLSSRLEKLETTITKLDRNIRHVESEMDHLSPEKNNGGGFHMNGQHGGNGPATGLFFPEKTRPKSTHGDPRHRTNGHSANNNGTNNVYTTPYPPPHSGTFGYRSAPSGKSRAVSRPSSAPMGNGNASSSHSNKSSMLQKAMEQMRSQIEEVEHKNSTQNSFLMNEVMETIRNQEGKTDRKLMGLDAKLRKYVDGAVANVEQSVSAGEENVSSKLAQLEIDVSQLQQEQDAKENEKEANTREPTFQHRENVPEIINSNQGDIDQMLEEQHQERIKLQEQFQLKEDALQRALENKENELRNVVSQNSSTNDAFEKLKEEARMFVIEKNRLKEEHMKHIAQLEKEFEERRTLIDERTELYKAETQRLQSVHNELQSHVNLEIKQRTEQLENEKNELEQKLLEEMSAHNLQVQKDRIIKESLQNEIEMFKKSCNQAHHDKDQILAKLQTAEAKYAQLEAKLLTSPPPKSANKNTTNSTPPPHSRLENTNSPANKSLHRLPSHPAPQHIHVNESDADDEEEGDRFSYETPVPKTKDPGDRRKSFQRADTPRMGAVDRVETPTVVIRKAPNRSDSGEDEKPNFFLSPDTTLKKQKSRKDNSSPRETPRQEVAENNNSNPFIGVSAVDDEKLQEMVQNKLTQNDIDDIIVLEELIKDREQEFEQANAAKSRAKKKIKNWMNEFQKVNKRPPNHQEKEGVSELYLNHQKLSESRDEIAATLEKMRETLNERVNKVVE